MKIFHIDTDVLAQKVLELERKGHYEEAFEHLQDVWSDTAVPPNIDHLEPQFAAEILLRCGSLIGFLGQTKQILNAQENSKNLLTEARNRFLNLYNFEKVAECEVYLAIAYSRIGEFLEAETWIEESLSHNISPICDSRIHSILIKSVVYQGLKKHEQVINLLENSEHLFRENGTPFLIGSFYTNLGMSFKNIGNSVKALAKYELAKFYHQKSGHQIYLGTIENNLAMIYKEEKRFDKAHQSIDSAINIFKQIKDKTREGFSIDTKALIYFAEEKFNEALATIESSFKILERGENKSYLVEVYQTKVKILVHLERLTDAMTALFEAYQIAKTHISEKVANDLLIKFEQTLLEKKTPVLKGIYTEKEIVELNDGFELILPKSISVKGSFHGVKIKNDVLENIGLKKGDLAIVVKTEVDKGDLVAVVEKETELVIFGYYDFDFGIVCLDNKVTEPQLFDNNEIEILGKIVGHCNLETKSNGKIKVQPINL